MLPNFVIPGFSRAGTTWLYSVLRKHPDIYLPKKKEIGYYDQNSGKGLKWYRRHYDGYCGERYAGDITPIYILRKDIAAKIKADLPDCKIIIILRNPVERLYSVYLRTFREKRLNYTFEELITHENFLHFQEEEYWDCQSCPDFVKLNFQLYFDKVEQYVKVFGRSNVLILYYEDSEVNPAGYIERILDFLKLPSAPFIHQNNLSIHKKENATVDPKSLSLHRLVQGLSKLGRKLNIKYIDFTVDYARDVYRKIMLDSQNIAVDEESRKKIELYFYEDIVQLSEFVNRDLIKHWGFGAISS